MHVCGRICGRICGRKPCKSVANKFKLPTFNWITLAFFLKKHWFSLARVQLHVVFILLLFFSSSSLTSLLPIVLLYHHYSEIKNISRSNVCVGVHYHPQKSYFGDMATKKIRGTFIVKVIASFPCVSLEGSYCSTIRECLGALEAPGE